MDFYIQGQRWGEGIAFVEEWSIIRQIGNFQTKNIFYVNNINIS